MTCGARRCLANFLLLLAALGIWMLRHFPPEASDFYPRCPFYETLHLYCPGCGATRAMAALLHARVGEALHWNAMAVVFAPFAVGFFAVSYWRAIARLDFLWPSVPNAFMKYALLLIGLFSLVRNIPVN